ncbi:serine/threonine protein kinase [Streptomyces cinnamoneus]|uniref:non-specific serine/threonine protein kinase n=2 Tax=Streptomyces cinnamoneus TaxID=53446 RepID=A0A2G1XC49_STRCJ|nr:serine/threonine protein kinase [Streptomyces cinnamoneus]PPT14563.1 serine/threonine protein kinase [Streptomyces cinnamoneus]
MGTVWRAEDELLARQVALKRLHVPLGLEEDELATLYERTRREARSAARINHANVVVVHDVVEDGGLPCIVMEYVPSTTLGDLLKRGTVSPDEAARIGRGMVAALRAAHAAGVLHRDVKPGNVLLGHDGRVVLTDFGIAHSTGTSTLTKTGEMVGSIDYIAPERVKGAKPGPAADLWALGATLYQALEGRPPFRKDTAVETAYSIAMDPLVPPRNAGPLTKLVETLLAKDPALRPPAELVEQILREPAAEPATASMRPPAASRGGVTAAGPPPGPPAGAGAGTATGTTAAVPTAATTAAPTTTSPTATATAATPRTPAKRRRAGWIATAATVVALVLAAGAYVLSKDGGADEEADAAPPSATPAPSRSSDAPAPPPVPKGYHLVEEKKVGVSFPVPDGWRREKIEENDSIVYVDPSGLVGLRVSVLDLASTDPLQHWKDDEAKSQAEGKLPGYRQLRMQSTTYRGRPAAIWEFTFKGRARDFRAADLGFGRPGEKEYAIYLSAPKAEWDRHKKVFDDVRDGFRMPEDR